MTRGRRLLYAYCLLAGVCDASTGALLLFAPTFTTRLMRLPELPIQPVYLSFIGAFVGSLGLFYLYPFIHGFTHKTDAMLDVVLRLTALARIVVGSFVTVSIFRELLPFEWASVALTDLTLAAVQIAILRGRRSAHA
jgi:hypothetical protein